MVDVGNLEECSGEELELMIYIQNRALTLMAGWFVKASQLCDKQEEPEDADDYVDRCEKLVDVAIRDAQSLIQYEDRVSEPGDAEAMLSDSRFKKLATEYGFAPQD